MMPTRSFKHKIHVSTGKIRKILIILITDHIHK